MDIKLKKEELNKKFQALEFEKASLNQRQSEILSEQLRLQGEFRLLEEMSRAEPESVEIIQ
jgi:hypothetical protein